MRLPDEARCHICKRIFCCGKCRQKHQFASHAISIREPLGAAAYMTEHQHPSETNVGTGHGVYVFCPICERKPLVLRQEIYAELMAHIESVHLPLRCRKCLKNYTRIEDLKEFTKCVDVNQNCTSSTSMSSCDTETSKVTVKKAAESSTISTQTSPVVTPISLINMRWKAKRQQEEHFNSDSVSSLSSISGCNLSAPCQTTKKGKLIRTTSTPLQVESSLMWAKPKEPLTFNASNNGSSISYPEEPSPHQPLSRHNWKAAAGASRQKISAVTTPLRQVMSKSIQKAFVEHGALMTTNPVAYNPQRRMRWDLSETEAGGSSALDLRLSPALRRTCSESGIQRSLPNAPSAELIVLSAQKLTTESIVITRNSLEGSSSCSTATVYNSCESVEIIRASSIDTPITRSIPGAPVINKKFIKFETPQKQQQMQTQQQQSSTKETFYTPNPGTPEITEQQLAARRQNIVPRQLSGQFLDKTQDITRPDNPQPRPPLRECQMAKSFSCAQEVPSEDEEVFLPNSASTRNDQKSNQGPGRLWSLMTSVMRLPSSLRGAAGAGDNENKENFASGSLIRRCASIAGSLVRSRTEDLADMSSLKRKRTHTLDSQYSGGSNSSPLSPAAVNSSKRYRIQPRRPIDRMRHN